MRTEAEPGTGPLLASTGWQQGVWDCVLHIVCVVQVCVSSMREAQELLRRAAKARQSSGTNANERSSRSHAVITVGGLKGLAGGRGGACDCHGC